MKLFLAAWLVIVTPATAHRLDEYLQASRLSIEVDRVELELDLTPGASIARDVYAWIGADRDAYAREVLDSLVLKVDGRPAALKLTAESFPELSEMIEGVGTIRLRATARIPNTAGRHELYFRNSHRPTSSVYLVNPMMPSNARITLGDPRRDRAQLSLTLDYTVAGDGPAPRSLMLFTALAMAIGLAVRVTSSALANSRTHS